MQVNARSKMKLVNNNRLSGHYKSDIPSGAQERDIGSLGASASSRTTECVWWGKVVGRRTYALDGALTMEIPLKNGERHGRVYCWCVDGVLLSVEPYVDGKVHGVAKQFDREGRVIGTYRMRHGTGLDRWYSQRPDGSTYVTELYCMQDGLRHGYEWWLDDRARLWREVHWQAWEKHGIERHWVRWGRGVRQDKGYPKFWIRNEQVIRTQYVQACKTDDSLPAYRKEDESQTRSFPKRIQRLLGIL